MKNIRIITGKEFRGYLNSPMAYIITCIFLLITGWFFASYLKSIEYTDTTLKGFLDYANIFLLLFAAVITMRSLAEEKKLGTWELLLTSPVKDAEVIIGKFFGGLGILALMLVLTMYYPLLLIIFGDPDMGPIWTSYLGLLLLGSSAIAVGIFASSLTSNQIIAAVVGGGILFALWYVGMAASIVPEAIGGVLSYISLSYHFSSFSYGIIDTRSIVYYLSITALFLYSAIRSLETSRWN
ncbi:MAG: ABC transporter permease subunit [Dehalococcoidales bacterium]|nr:ABC transporter permease subunit [Dehalococcoidales bacterium]